MKRKQHSKEFKAKVALEALKGQKTANEIATEYGYTRARSTPGRSGRWKGCRKLFSRGQDRDAAQREAEKDRLYQQIGKLQVEVDWLKKKTGHLD